MSEHRLWSEIKAERMQSPEARAAYEPQPVDVQCIICDRRGAAGSYRDSDFDGFSFVTSQSFGMATGIRLWFCPLHYREMVEKAQRISL